MFQICKKDVSKTVKIALIYCILSAAFSLVGMLVLEKGPVPNPVGHLTVQEVGGHLIWGLAAGAVTLSARYVILTGLFAVLIDSDHVIGLTHTDALVRMSHSISFGIISVIVLMVLFGKKDYRLGAAAIAGLFAHLSFDTFAGDDEKFPIFTPLYNHQISFPSQDWIYFEIIAIIVVGVITYITAKKRSEITV